MMVAEELLPCQVIIFEFMAPFYKRPKGFRKVDRVNSPEIKRQQISLKNKLFRS